MSIAESERPTLMPFAVQKERTRGRAHPRSEAGDDDPFELDRYRILTCTAFRRLMHKTQVFIGDGDHFRTRLTHTLEVVAQAERLARLLGLNDRLAGAIGLAHDLGHAPFGHAGEKALNDLMKDHGGFEHNLQSLRVVDYLEHPFPAFRGLNLTYEVREALVKHQTRYDKPQPHRRADPKLAQLIESGPQCSLEGQVANLADAVAYTLHDIEDGLGAGVLDEESLAASGLWREAAEPVRRSHPDASILALRRPIIDRIAARLAEDAAATSRGRIDAAGVRHVDDVRKTGQALIGFSTDVQRMLDELQSVLIEHVYRNHRVVRMDAKAGRLIRQVFEVYTAEPRLVPERFRSRITEQGLHRVVCDYVAGMTDRFLQREHERLFAPFQFE